MDWLTSPDAWIALLSLTLIEIVLGIDNIVFISVLVGRLPQEQQQRARILGLSLAMILRIIMLFLITAIMKLDGSLFAVLGNEISGRDLILIGGGLFLLAKSTQEIHDAVEGASESSHSAAPATFGSVLLQIGVIDLVFSIDSVITAVGMADHVAVMVIAVIISIGVMMAASGPISRFVESRPTVKMLALSFLVLIGTALIAEGLDVHFPKGYIYFAMAFSIAVEMLNLKIRGRGQPVQLHQRMRAPNPEDN